MLEILFTSRAWMYNIATCCVLTQILGALLIGTFYHPFKVTIKVCTGISRKEYSIISEKDGGEGGRGSSDHLLYNSLIRQFSY